MCGDTEIERQEFHKKLIREFIVGDKVKLKNNKLKGGTVIFSSKNTVHVRWKNKEIHSLYPKQIILE